MRLTEILQPDAVKVPLAAQNKQDAIRELVDLIAAHTGLISTQELMDAVWQREMTRTTGIGHGIAIPHGKSASCTRLSMAVGRLETPIDFKAIDGRPVELVILLASPLDQTGPHIQALARITRILTNEKIRHLITQAPTANDLYSLLAQHDTELQS